MLRKLAKDISGAVLVEFALVAPLMLIMYVGGVTVSDMISCNRKVTIATRELTDLVSRNMSPSIIYNRPGSASATTYLSAGGIVLAPYDLTKANEQISLLRVCDATHAYVVWTQAQTQNADGSTTAVATSTQTAGTLPTSQAQLAASVVTIPDNMVTAAMIPSSPDGTNVCNNLDVGTSTTTQVGTAGGWLFMGQIKYAYTPFMGFGPVTTNNMVDVIYMSPRLS
jgi:Flp pilus assembly protein TadG